MESGPVPKRCDTISKDKEAGSILECSGNHKHSEWLGFLAMCVKGVVSRVDFS